MEPVHVQVQNRRTSFGIKEIIALAIFSGGLIGLYNNFQLRMQEMELRINNMEVNFKANTRSFDKIDTKLDNITDAVYELKIEMQKKQDRP